MQGTDDIASSLSNAPTAGGVPATLQVQRKAQGTRLDRYLVAAFPGYSRSALQKAIEAGQVLVNDTPCKASYRLRPGDVIRVTLPAPVHDQPQPENIPLDVLYEDEYLAVIDKPADMVVHPAKGHWQGTLANALAFRFGHLSQAGGDYRPGIVHRLDRDTSGVILVAKQESAHRDLSAQFENRTVFKEYLAITQGELERDSDYIERPIGRHRFDRERMATYEEPDEEEDIKDACTFYEVIERFTGYTYCRVQPRTGRTHQIRVHLASIGCPIVADRTYSGRDVLKLSQLLPDLPAEQDEILMPRQALHAYRLRFRHPVLQRIMEVSAPIPKEFLRTLEALRRYRPPPA
ncbi:MAG: RluA family pseudouridine synthase [Gemmataceae bacterium]